MKELKYIIIALLFLSGTNMVVAQVRVLTGTVSEANKGAISPLADVTVDVVGRNKRVVKRTTSDQNGKYRLQIPDNEGNIELVFYASGMKRQQFDYTGQKVLDVVMESRIPSRVLTGRISERIGGVKEPLMGVNINAVNSDNRSVRGTVTDIDGFYRLQIPDNEDHLTLVFSFIGMKTKKMEYTGQKELDVILDANVQDLKEVAVTARRIERNDMGISFKESVTATQKVDMEDIISTVPVYTVEEALQGRMGGVDVIMGGGDPGARSSIRIRGTSTLNSSAEPLIVIDGVPYPTDIDEDFDFSTANNEDLGALLNIAPTDIESVEVLKDAAATAIWGTKGSNGVLVITTKKGKSGKTNFSYSSKFTAKTEPRTIPMLNGMEYTALMQEAIWNSANYVGMVNSSNKYLKMLYDTPEIGYSPDWKYFDEYNQDTDWLDEIRKTAFSWDNNFSMSGGGERATYRFSLGYLSEGGTTVGTGLQRLNTSTTINYMFSNKLKFGADFMYSQSDKQADWAGNLRSEAFRKMPNKSPYWVDDATGRRTSQFFAYQTDDFEGAFSGNEREAKSQNYNPVAKALKSYNNSTQREEKITFRIDYNLLPELTYKAWASINMRTTKGRKFLPQMATGVVWTDSWANRSADLYSDQMSLQFENKLIFIKNWNSKHNLIATGVVRTSQTEKSSYSSITSGNASSGLSDPIIGSTVEGMNSGESEIRSVSGIGLVNYTLLDRYVVQTSLTAEGNSAMGKSNRVGYFPTLGLSYNLHNEPFMFGIKKWVDETKLRFTVGQSGKAPSGASLYLGSFQGMDNDYMNMPAIYPYTIQLNNLKWETSTEYNVGIDLGFMQGKVRVTYEWYKKYVKDLLLKDMKIPTSTGYKEIDYFNSGRLTNTGWEFRTDVVLYENKDWRVGAYVNLSRNINEVTELPENMRQDNYTFDNGNYAVMIEEGRPIGSFYGYRYVGVYQNKEATFARDQSGNVMNDVSGNPIVMKNGQATVYPGDAQYEDVNHDGVINEYDIVYLGNYMPVIIGGTGFSVRWKQLTLNAFLHGRFGQKIINRVRMQNEAMYNVNNQSTAVLRRWRNEGDDTEIPRALFREGYNWLGSDRFVEDASYLRLKSLSLTYALPKDLCKKIGLNAMNLFVTGYDLLTFTKYTGQDPEVSLPGSATKMAEDKANTPCPVRFSGGFNVNF